MHHTSFIWRPLCVKSCQNAHTYLFAHISIIPCSQSLHNCSFRHVKDKRAKSTSLQALYSRRSWMEILQRERKVLLPTSRCAPSHLSVSITTSPDVSAIRADAFVNPESATLSGLSWSDSIAVMNLLTRKGQIYVIYVLNLPQHAFFALRRKSPRGRSPSGKVSRPPCKKYAKGTCTNPSCDSWTSPWCLFFRRKRDANSRKCAHSHIGRLKVSLARNLERMVTLVL